MRRRDLISAAFGSLGYTMIVKAQAPPDATAAHTPVGREIIDRIEPLSRPEPGRAPLPEANMRLVQMECDVLIAGGGPAGVNAALAATRHGAKVILVQDRSRLGGNSSSEVRMHIVGANTHKKRPGWREGGIIEELRLEDAVSNPQRCWELWDLLLYDKCVSEPNMTLLLDTAIYSAETKDNSIEYVLARCDKTEHIYRIQAGIYVDCTGDSRLGLEAGADTRYGREARSEYGESLAPEKADQLTMGNSILFTSKRHDKPMPFTPPKWARTIDPRHMVHRGTNRWEYGYWWIEWGGQMNTIHDNERIRFELLSIVMGVWDHIKNSGAFPSAENWAMDWVGMVPGKRESRRLIGDYTLKQQDLLEGDFDDAVAIGGWPMDDHPPGGFDRADLPPAHQVHTPEVYNIPLRSLYSRNIDNLMMAGRNISASHVAFSSTRVMATCSVLGQAAGTAAAMCAGHQVSPKKLAGSRKAVKKLQQALLRDDQTIKNLRNEDPLDLARTAKIHASGHEKGNEPEKLTNGLVRDPSKRKWEHWSQELFKEPVWIELEWDAPQSVGFVQITFDTGFERELTLTASDSINRGIKREPQPETVRDYSLLVQEPGSTEYRPVAEVKGNYQRLARHQFQPVRAKRLRLRIDATNGDIFARVFELRCYAENPLRFA
jgi:hypothetical protein